MTEISSITPENKKIYLVINKYNKMKSRRQEANEEFYIYAGALKPALREARNCNRTVKRLSIKEIDEDGIKALRVAHEALSDFLNAYTNCKAVEVELEHAANSYRDLPAHISKPCELF